MHFLEKEIKNIGKYTKDIIIKFRYKLMPYKKLINNIKGYCELVMLD